MNRMAESKKKKYKKRKKQFPPLSKQDKFLYNCIEVVGAVILIAFVVMFESLTSFFVFRNTDALAYEPRLTVILFAPVVFFWLYLLIRMTSKKIPIIGNKQIDYYNTTEYKFVLPLFDNRYKNNEKYKKAKKEFLKKVILHVAVFLCLLSIGCMGCVGRTAFNANGITTYSILNNVTKEYSYDDVDSYTVRAVTHYVNRPRGLSYRTYDVHLTVNLKNGESFTASYDTARDVYSLAKIDRLLKDKNKTVNADNLQMFLDKHNFSDEELSLLHKIFEE